MNRATSSYERCQPTIEFFWWCPECGIEVEPSEIAEDGTHDVYEGGCGQQADYCYRRKKKKQSRYNTIVKSYERGGLIE